MAGGGFATKSRRSYCPRKAIGFAAAFSGTANNTVVCNRGQYITEVPAKDGKLYVSAIFDCFDVAVIGLAMADNMKAELCVQTLENACRSYPGLRGAIIHSDRGSQYTSVKYRAAIQKYRIQQSMNSAEEDVTIMPAVKACGQE